VLVEHAATDSVLRKKLGILLAETEGTEKLSNEIENRIRTIGGSRSFVDWDKRKGLIQELNPCAPPSPARWRSKIPCWRPSEGGN
jgi:hypothetical protein